MNTLDDLRTATALAHLWSCAGAPCAVRDFEKVDARILRVVVRQDSTRDLRRIGEEGGEVINAKQPFDDDGRLATGFHADIRSFDAKQGELLLQPKANTPALDPALPLWVLSTDFLRPLRDFVNALKPDHPTVGRLLDLAARLAAEGPPENPAGAPPLPAFLRPSQAAAVLASERRLSLIWGPPGTGKTFTLGTLVARHRALGRRVLLLATTNAATDVLTLAVDDACNKTTRPLAPTELIRLSQHLTREEEYRRRPHLLHYSETLAALNRRQTELKTELASVSREIELAPDDETALRLRVEANGLNEEIRTLGQNRSNILNRLIENARIVAVSCTSALFRGLLGKGFDTVVVDEASQVPLALWAYLLSQPDLRLVVAGDPFQLRPIPPPDPDPALMGIRPPDADSRRLVEHWFSRTLYDHLRLLDGLDSPVVRRLEASRHLTFLDVQTRMHATIGGAVSRTFYAGRLSGGNPGALPWHPGAYLHGAPSLAILHKTAISVAPTIPLRRGKTSGFGTNSDARSADLVTALVARLRDDWARTGETRPLEILVLTPFRNQLDTLKSRLASLRRTGIDLRIGTVHTNQGAEADIVLFDSVDCDHHFISKGAEARHIWCVAASRARHHLLLVAPPAEAGRGRWSGPLFADAAHLTHAP